MLAETVLAPPARALAGFSWRPIASAVAALLGFLVVCLILRNVFPLHVAGVSYKLESFARQKDNFDVVFTGTSRVFHGISPAAFDEATRALGCPSRSFNSGADGMSAGEGFSLTRRLLTLHPRQLRYLFFELASGVEAGTPIDNQAVTVRNVYWRDWDSLVSGFRTFWMGISRLDPKIDGPPYSWRRFALYTPIFSANVRLWARNETGLGEGFDRLKQTVARLRHRGFSDRPPPPNWDGYFPMSKPMTGETLTTYRKDFAKVRNHPGNRQPDPITRSELARYARDLEARGVRVVFVVPPSLLGGRDAGVNCPPGSLLFAYDDYLRYPQFYAEENRLDDEHLNARGAELFSRTLAADFLNAVKPPDR